VAQRLTLILNGEVDERGRPAEQRGTRSSFEIVSAGRSSEWHVEVGMDINTSWHYVLAGSIQHAPRVFAWQTFAYGNNLPVRNRHIGSIRIRRRNHRAACDDAVKRHH
jgi:hypothetical protein